MSDHHVSPEPPAGLLGDTPDRSYAAKLDRTARFLEPELRAIIAGLGIRPGDRILDAGCGAGLVTGWLAEATGSTGSAVGVDLSHDHIAVAQGRSRLPTGTVRFLQGDITQPTFGAGSFDLVWTRNTLNHLADPAAGLRTLASIVDPGGRVAIVQDLLLPEMVFPWDERLEQAVVQACRAHYRDRYGLDHRRISGHRNLVGWMLDAGLGAVEVRTMVAERIQPLAQADIDHLQHGLFEGYWGDRVRPYLDAEDWEALCRLTDPGSDDWALRRPDLHILQTVTLVAGRVDG
jgi:SAM-dependent methyltransferase